MFARFDENPAMTLQDIKKKKRYGRTEGRTHTRTHARTDNVKTVYPTTNKVCGGYKNYPACRVKAGSMHTIQKNRSITMGMAFSRRQQKHEQNYPACKDLKQGHDIY